MGSASLNQMARQALEENDGILRLAPTWVPRSYMVPGRRLKLDSRDLYAYGFLPPRLFNALMAKLTEVWTEGQGKATPRD